MIQQIKKEFERRLKDENLRRIHLCLDKLDNSTAWYSPNDQVNSVANLVLHLSGNIQQYIHSTFGNQEDNRTRSSEFSVYQTHSIQELKDIIEETIRGAVDIIHQQKEKDILLDYNVQSFKESGLSIIIHVIEHTSYHTGQITQMTKWLKNIDTQYYSNLNLDSTK